MIPLHIGSEQDFAALRALFLDADFTAHTVERRFGLETLGHFDEDFDRAQIEPWDNSPAGVLIRIFIELHIVDEAAARSQLSPESLDALERLGLIDRTEGKIAARAALYPTAGVWIASDLWQRPDRTPFQPQPDIVYSAIVANAYRFVSALPTSPADDFLDLCSGSGVAALSAAKFHARSAYSFDLAQRSCDYAEFNKHLNGLENVIVKQGDLYEPAGDQTFDRIVAHPPYVPVLRPKYIYHDGGEDGEWIARRIVQGLPKHLRPGGLFFMLAMMTEREDSKLESRIREWLGPESQDFDVTCWTVWSRTPSEYAVQASARSKEPLEDMKRFKELFARQKIENLVYGYYYFQRRAEDRPTFTIRRNLGPDTRVADIRRVIELETLRLQNGGLARILAARASVNLATELRISHKLTHDGWEPDSNLLITTKPFPMEARVDLWAPYLMAVCGDSKTKTVAEIFRDLQEQEVLPQQADPLEFAQAVSVLASGGFLELEVTG